VAELSPRPDAPAVMRKLPDRRVGTKSPALRLGLDSEVPSLGLRPEGGASVDHQLLRGRDAGRPGAPRTDPSERNYRTGLPPQVRRQSRSSGQGCTMRG
jgi:hypothetical protein